MADHVKRAFKYRFYPNDAQAAQLTRTFGCVRKVYNLALQARTTAWFTERRRINYVQTSALLTDWKKTEEYAFLAEVSSVPLQQTLRHLQGAFNNFFERRSAYPRFKSLKKSRKSAEYTRSAFTYCDGRLTLAKMQEPLAIAWSRPLPEGQVPSTVTVSQDGAGRWFVSMLCEDASVKALGRQCGSGRRCRHHLAGDSVDRRKGHQPEVREEGPGQACPRPARTVPQGGGFQEPQQGPCPGRRHPCPDRRPAPGLPAQTVNASRS